MRIVIIIISSSSSSSRERQPCGRVRRGIRGEPPSLTVRYRARSRSYKKSVFVCNDFAAQTQSESILAAAASS